MTCLYKEYRIMEKRIIFRWNYGKTNYLDETMAFKDVLTLFVAIYWMIGHLQIYWYFNKAIIIHFYSPINLDLRIILEMFSVESI